MESMGEEAITGAYVVDGNHRLVYFNHAMEKAFPYLRVGEFCYREMCNQTEPCAICPLRLVQDEKMVAYNSALQVWSEVEVSAIEWPGVGPCNILLCRALEGQEIPDQLHALSGGKAVDQVDSLTGLRLRMSFLRDVFQRIIDCPEQAYCLMAIDIEHFKLFNEWHGEEAGDQLLSEIAALLLQMEADHGAIAGYLAGDDFCILLPKSDEIINDLQRRITETVRFFGKEMAFLPVFGLYAIDDPRVPASTMHDRALLALASVKGNYAQSSAWFEPSMMQEMEDDHALLHDVQHALANDEFTFYLQPKCNMVSGKIVAAESLARWVHPQQGLIPPDRFIPMLERNGLITALDRYLWEQVCKTLRSWIDQGIAPVTLSINVSRRDLYALNVGEVLTNLVQKYNIEPRYIAVEITESAYVEGSETMLPLIDDLRTRGFVVLMDDFGSGYSSLNMLKDLTVDVLKLDMKLLDVNTEQQLKGKGILESIVNMARLVDLRIVAEGVETEEQRDFLTKIGCLYAQGYLFYRPMPIEEFEKLLADRKVIDYRGIMAAPIKNLQARQLLNDSLLSDTMVDDILGAIAFYDVFDKKVEVVSSNERYCRLVGISSIDLEERRKVIASMVYKDDRALLMEVFEQAYRNAPGGAEVDVRRMKPDSTTVHVHFRVFYLRERDGHRLYYGSLTDITDQVEKTRKLEASQRALLSTMRTLTGDEAFMSLPEENRRTALAISAQMSPGGMIGGYCEEGFPLYFANAAMVELLGYDSYEELAEAIGGLVGNTIHPDDAAKVAQDIGPEYYVGLEYTTTYRMPKKDGTWFWTLDKGKVVEADNGRLAIVSACADISEAMQMQQQLAERNELLLGQNRELLFLNEDMPGGYHRCADTPGFDFLFMSDRFVEMTGFSRKEIKELFGDKFADMIHPDDSERVGAEVAALKKTNTSDVLSIEYRLKSKTGYLTVLDQTRYLSYEGVTFLQGMVVDITETVELRDAMRMLMEHTPDDIAVLSWTDREQVCVETIAYGIARKYSCSEEDFRAHLLNRLYTENEDSGRRMIDEIAAAIEQSCDITFTFKTRYRGATDIWVRLEAQRIESTPGHYLAFVLGTDVTDLKVREEEIRGAQNELTRMAETDVLTGLSNRQTAVPRIEKRLRELREAGCSQNGALIMIDMDDFKLANDVFGHAYGDTVISQTAHALKAAFPRDIVCRMGGDEFMVWAEYKEEDELRGVIAQALKAMQVFRDSDNRPFMFSASAGYALAVEEGFSFDELYQKADIALFSVKMDGKKSFARYKDSMKNIRYELAGKRLQGKR